MREFRRGQQALLAACLILAAPALAAAEDRAQPVLQTAPAMEAASPVLSVQPAAGASAATPAVESAPPPALRIAEVHIAGAPDELAPEILKVSGLRGGDMFTLAGVRQAIKAIMGRPTLSRIQDVQVRGSKSPGGVSLTIEVKLSNTIASIEVTGARRLSASEILGAADLEIGSIFRPRTLESARLRVIAAYERQGYFNVEAALETAPAGPGETAIMINIRENAPARISDVQFTGPIEDPPDLLKEELGLRKGDILRAADLEQAEKNLLDHYRRRGYREARLREGDRREFSADKSRVTVHFRLDPGLKTRLRFHGNHRVRAKDIIDAVELDRVSEYPIIERKHGCAEQRRMENPDRVADALPQITQRMVRYYRSLGYFHAAARSAVCVDGAFKRVDFFIEEGPVARIRSIRFVKAANAPPDEPGGWFPGGGARDGQNNQPLPPVEAFPETTLRGVLSRALRFSDGEETVDSMDGGVLPNLEISGRPRVWPGQSQEKLRPYPDEIYDEERFSRGLAALEEYYRSNGYLNVRIEPPEVHATADRSGLYLRIEIDEGPQTLVEHIEFAGAEAIPESLLRPQVPLRSGDPVDLAVVEAARARLAETYENLGYVFARVEYSLKRDDPRRGVIRYSISEGPQVTVGAVLPRRESLRRTNVRVVIEHLMFSEGDVYTPAKAQESQRNLLRLGVFDRATIGLAEPDKPAPVKDVVVDVRERNFQSLEPGFGLSTDQGVRAFVEYAHANLGGSALELMARARLNYRIFDLFLGDKLLADRLQALTWENAIERRFDVGLNYPRVYGITRAGGFPANISARFDLINERKNARAYGLDRLSGVPGVSIEFIRRLTLTVQYELEYNYMVPVAVTLRASGERPGIDQESLFFLRTPRGATVLGSFRPVLSIDRRDSAFNPRTGYFASLTAEQTHTIGGAVNANFLKLTALTSAYVPLGSKVTLAVSLRGGNIFSVSSLDAFGKNLISGMSENDLLTDERLRTPLNKRFYLGGRASLRGFNEDAVVAAFSQTPQSDIDDARNNRSLVLTSGGNTFVLAKTELRFPIAGALSGAAFFDAGGLWLRLGDFRLTDIRPGTGAGIRYATPIGPVALDLGFNPMPNTVIGEPGFVLHFSIGVF
ncbi:MAG: Outer membrane protein assembly factor BamA [Myxococcota bacterium]|nr:Outer membrane protein assembly factor BamA [Myxococcota bacterium]